MIIVADTGFLSSLLKIKRADLMLKLFEVDSALVPLQVFRELEKSRFFGSVAHLFSYNKNAESWVQVVPIEISEEPDFGLGELASIKLAKEKKAILLIDDKKARNRAKKEGLVAISLAEFLLSCRRTDVLSKNELRPILADLRKADNYVFSKEVEGLILHD